MLSAVDEVRLRRVGRIADPGVPQWCAVAGTQRHEVSTTVAGEDHPARCCQQPAAAATDERMAPGDAAGLVVDRRHEVAERPEPEHGLAAESHRSAWIGIG